VTRAGLPASAWPSALGEQAIANAAYDYVATAVS